MAQNAIIFNATGETDEIAQEIAKGFRKLGGNSISTGRQMVRMRALYDSFKKALLLPFLGFCLAVAYDTSFNLFVFDAETLSATTLPLFVFGIAQAFGYVAVALLAKNNLFERLRKRHTVEVCLLGIICATIGQNYTFVLSGAFIIAGALFAALGTAALYLMWIELYSRLDQHRLLFHLCLVHILSAVVSLGLAFLGHNLSTGILLGLLPVLSFFAYRSSINIVNEKKLARGETITTNWSFPFRPVIIIAIFTLSNHFVRSCLLPSAFALTTLGVIVAVIPILFHILVSFKRFSIKSLYRLALPFILAGLLCLLMDNAGLIGALFSNAAFSFFSIFVTTLLCSISFRYGVNAIWLVGIAMGASSFAGLLGDSFALYYESNINNDTVLIIIVSILIVFLAYIFVVFATEKGFTDSWGISPLSQQTMGQVYLDQIVEAASRLSRDYGLTRREEEVLSLLIQNKTVSFIKNELCVSDATIKSHIQHIYKKIEVHNREELMELFAKY